MADQPQQQGSSSSALEREREDPPTIQDADPPRSPMVAEEHPAQSGSPPPEDMPSLEDTVMEKQPAPPEDMPAHEDNMVTEEHTAQPGSPPPAEDMPALEDIAMEERPAQPGSPRQEDVPALENLVVTEEHSAQSASPPLTQTVEDLLACVDALDNALLHCLPSRELQVVHGFVRFPNHQIDIERHVRDFMEPAKKLQCFFIGLQQNGKPSRKEILQKEIAMMEEELKQKSELIEKFNGQIDMWRKEFKEQLEKHQTALE